MCLFDCGRGASRIVRASATAAATWDLYVVRGVKWVGPDFPAPSTAVAEFASLVTATLAPLRLGLPPRLLTISSSFVLKNQRFTVCSLPPCHHWLAVNVCWRYTALRRWIVRVRQRGEGAQLWRHVTVETDGVWRIVNLHGIFNLVGVVLSLLGCTH